MKLLFLILFLVPLQTLLSPPRATKDVSSNNIKTNSGNKKNPPAPTPPAIINHQAERNQNQRQEITTDNQRCSIEVSPSPFIVKVTDSSWNIVLVFLTGALVFVGVFQIYFLWGTVLATRDNAKAALDNIKIYKSKERARLSVDFKPLDLKQRATPTSTARVVEFTVSIYGPTAATILDSGLMTGIWPKVMETCQDLGEAIISPIRQLPNRILPNTTPLERITILFFLDALSESANLEVIQKEEMIPVVRGFIRYQDIFDAVWTIRFRCYWGPPPDSRIFGELWQDVNNGQWISCGPPEENQETS